MGDQTIDTSMSELTEFAVKSVVNFLSRCATAGWYRRGCKICYTLPVKLPDVCKIEPACMDLLPVRLPFSLITLCKCRVCFVLFLCFLVNCLSILPPPSPRSTHSNSTCTANSGKISILPRITNPSSLSASFQTEKFYKSKRAFKMCMLHIILNAHRVGLLKCGNMGVRKKTQQCRSLASVYSLHLYRQIHFFFWFMSAQ